MLVTLLPLLPLVLASISLPSLGFIQRSIPPCKSPLEVVHPSFPLPMSTMPSTSSPLTRQKMLS
ncbi:hypothetical protein EDD16DRAFT_1653477, partial [Pisolithus croceorrhizus]